jgi:dCMP deaminase
MSRTQDWWDRYFLNMAKQASTASKDPSTQVGAVITDGNRLVSVGFNGFARGVRDLPWRYADRDTKLRIGLHGELNAILFAGRSLAGCTLYTFPLMSCSNCAAAVVQVGITRCVAPPTPPDLEERWAESLKWAKTQFEEASVRLDIVEL